MLTVSVKATLRPGAVRARGARPYGVQPPMGIRTLARLGFGRAVRAPLGQQPTFAYPLRRLGGNQKVLLIFTRAARPEGKRVIDKREKTAGCLPLARSAAAHTRRSGRPASNRPKGGS